MIEIKNSIGSVDVKQFEKYINSNSSGYINVTNKKVILYIDKSLDDISSLNKDKLMTIKNMGIQVVNSLDELKGVLE